MSNTALKFRPQLFEEFIGQDHIVESLKNTIKNNSISHAYLFSGPRGVGKTSTARVFSKAINCENGPTVNPCNKCRNCVEITKGISPDVIEIDAASNRGIDQIRDIRSNAQFLPSYSRYKVYIIDEVHMLTDAAFNALLKTLEEPPSHVVFILATTEPHKVKLTIRSRCQHFRFRPLSIKDIKDHLSNVCEKLGIKHDDASLEIIAKLSDGSVRDSLSLLDLVSIYSNFNINEKILKDIVGFIPDDLINDFINGIVEKDFKKIYFLIEKLYNTGIDVGFFIEELINAFRYILLSKNNIQLSDKYVHFISYFENYQLQKIIDILFSLLKEIKSMDKNRFLVENSFLYLMNYRTFVDLENVLNRIEKLEKRLGIELKREAVIQLIDTKELETNKEVDRKVTKDININNIGEKLEKSEKLDVETLWKKLKQKIAEKSPKWIAIIDDVKDIKYNDKGKELLLIFSNPYEEGFFKKEGELNKQIIDFFNKFEFNIKKIKISVEKKIKEKDDINIVELIKKEFNGKEV